MIIPLLTSSPWDLSFPTTLSLDLGIGSPRGRQSTPVKCPQEGEWKGQTASCPAFRHNLPCPSTWKEQAGKLPSREAAKGVEGSLQSQKVSWNQGQVLSQILTGLLPFGSYGIPGGIKRSRDWDPAGEETWGSSGNTEKCFCHRGTIRQPALASEMPHFKSNIPKWCILNI